MLTFDAVVDAINQIEAKRGGAAPAKRDGERTRRRRPIAPRPAPRRPRPGQGLSLHALAAGRLPLPPPADLLRICRRGARPLRPVGRRVDDARAHRCAASRGARPASTACPRPRRRARTGTRPGATPAGRGVSAPTERAAPAAAIASPEPNSAAFAYQARACAASAAMPSTPSLRSTLRRRRSRRARAPSAHRRPPRRA